MSKFNTKTEGTKTINLAGGESFKETSKLEFVSILLTSFVESQYYKSSADTLKRLKELFSKVTDKKFLAKAAIYARTKYGMRSITHVVAGEIAKNVKGESWVKRFINKVVKRPDDMTEVMSYYTSNYGKRPIPNSLKKGLASAFDKFDTYSLSKYRGERKSFSLIDLVNLVRPKPTEKNAEALKSLVEGTLKATDTWEVQQTQAGQKAKNEDEKKELKKDSWIELVKTKKIGYFALLRNLRNIIEQAPEVITEACAMLTDENLIKKSLVLPFRFTTALNEIEKLGAGTSEVLVALNKAIDISCNNVPKFDGKTLVVLDHSGSMGDGLDDYVGKASLFGTVLAKACDSDVMIFGTHAKYVPINPLDSTLTTTKRIVGYNQGSSWAFSDRKPKADSFNVGHGTDFTSIFKEANRAYDRIVIFSDMQGWIGYDTPTREFNNYKIKYTANPHIYSVDLAGYGTLQFPEKQVYCLAGFSEKIFDVMSMLESDKEALINDIEKIVL